VALPPPSLRDPRTPGDAQRPKPSLTTADAPPPSNDDAAPRAAETEDLDKYDVSTLACTD
jgi:hypothetical protein